MHKTHACLPCWGSEALCSPGSEKDQGPPVPPRARSVAPGTSCTVQKLPLALTPSCLGGQHRANCRPSGTGARGLRAGGRLARWQKGGPVGGQTQALSHRTGPPQAWHDPSLCPPSQPRIPSCRDSNLKPISGLSLGLGDRRGRGGEPRATSGSLLDDVAVVVLKAHGIQDAVVTGRDFAASEKKW